MHKKNSGQRQPQIKMRFDGQTAELTDLGLVLARDQYAEHVRNTPSMADSAQGSIPSFSTCSRGSEVSKIM